MASTYILRCCDNRYYVGSTIDLENRLKNHARGKCRFTKSRLPVKLIHREDYVTLSKAKKREYEIKSCKSRQAIEKLLK